jgi:hypothetical protein
MKTAMPRTKIPVPLRRLVIARAQECCEYCRLPLRFAEAPHELDHLIASKQGGQTISENLALACLNCNRFKGSNLSGIDPLDGSLAALFNPRTQDWNEHFELDGAHSGGLTPSGRATVAVLRFNDEIRVLQRRALIMAGKYPPESRNFDEIRHDAANS